MYNKIIKKIKENKLLVVLLLLFFSLNIFVIYNTFSEKTTSSIWDGSIATKFSGGDGSVTKPYIIKDGSELAYLFTLINSEDNSEYFNKFYSLQNNINLNGKDFSFAEYDKKFSGNFNGNGYSIFNFNISKYYIDEEEKTAYVSLLDSLYSSNIHDLNIRDVTFVVDSDDIINNSVKKSNSDNEDVNANEAVVIDNKDNSETSNSSDSEKNKIEENIKDNTDSTIDSTQNNENETEKNSEESKEEVTNENTEDNVKTEEENTNDVTKEGSEENLEVEENPDEVVQTKIENFEIALFRNVEQTVLNNISINNIKVNYKGNLEIVRSSLFVLNDVSNNRISNININGESTINDTTVLINYYNDASINNIISSTNSLTLINNYEEENSTIYSYKIVDGKLTFDNSYPVKSILETFNNNSNYLWKFENNQFRIVNNGKDDTKNTLKARKMIRSIPSGHKSGIEGDTVYVNDYESDANYYDGLNYTYSSDFKTPTTEKKNIYIDSNLVFVQVNYSGTDKSNTYTGYVSNSESQSKYVYYKIYKVNDNGTGDTSDDYVEFELIDNPFARRPNSRVFNGWITDYEGATISLNTDIYVRSIKIPVTYNGNNPNNININVYAVWGEGSITNYRNSTYGYAWSDTFSYLSSKGFHSVSSFITEYESVTPYYVRATARYNRTYPSDAVNNYGEALTGTCNSIFGCTYYTHATGSYNAGTTYYELDGTMQTHTVQSYQVYQSDIPVGESIAGYYRQVTIPRNASTTGYFDTNGNSLNGTCTSNNCTCYELIPYYDDNGDEEVVISGTLYYYLTTRDTNIVVMTSNVSSTWSSNQNKPFTLTGINNGTNYYTSYYWNTRSAYVQAYADTRIEFLRIYGPANLNTDTSPGVRSTNYNTSPAAGGMFGNYYNLKIGRGLVRYDDSASNFTYVAGGNNTSTGGSRSSLTKYRLIIESGFYNNLSLTSVLYGNNNNQTREYYIDVTGIYGNDYDRVHGNDNDNLEVKYCASGSWSGLLYGESVTKPMLHTIVKSGSYGTNKYDYAAGLYVGGRGYGEHNSAREAIIEGGYIYNLIGGPFSQEANKQYNDAYIYMKGGSVDIIIGGAGRSTTYGNRIISVTDGTVNYAVFGGSNGIEGNDSNYNSTVDGDSYVYIGGSAVIGNTALGEDAIESTSMVEAGSVFGIGNGREGYSEIGTVNNSNVVIDGNAIINKNVYGGGNYGATGQNGSNKTYNTNIVIHSGEIKGSVYGGGNNNGAGSTSNTTNISISMDGGEVSGSIYGGSRSKGRIYGSTNINVTAGTVYSDIYGGGEGGYEDDNNYGTYVRDNVDITIGNSSGGPTINGSVYGGSAFGSVNTVSENATANNNTINVTVNNGNILNSVYGGAKGSDTFTPQVCGNITVDINGGTIPSVYGGCDQSGKPLGSATVYMDGGTVTNIYGGGNKTSIDDTNIYLRGGTSTTVYGGSNQLGDVINTNIHVQGGITNTIFGGNNEGGTCQNTNIDVHGGTINTAIYGGGNLVDTISTKIDIYKIENTLPAVYGGGNQAGATTTLINTYSGEGNVNITDVYGGSNQSGNVGESTINVRHGNITSVYGGNNAGGETDKTNVNISGGTITTVYGGGNEADTTNTNVSITNGTINLVYGGGNQAKVKEDTNVSMSGGTVNTTIYGGGNEGAINGETHVTITGGTSDKVFGGGNKAAVEKNTHVDFNNGTTNTIFGGGNQAEVKENTYVNVNGGTINTAIYGGGNEGAINGNTNVVVTNVANTLPDLYGGGNQAGASTTNVTLNGNANYTITNIYGGSNQAGTVNTSNVIINNGTSTNVYGGNNAGGKTATTNVTLNNGTISTIYGGGNEAISDDTHVTINNGSIQDIYGGGNKANITNSTNVEVIKSTSQISSIYGGGNQAGASTTNVNINPADTINITNVYGGSNQAGTIGKSNVIVNNGTISNLYGGNNAGGQTNDANLTLNNGTVNNMFGGGNRAVTGKTNVLINNGHINVLYGGGDAAGVNQDTILTMLGGSTTSNIYGGGNQGAVGGNTTVVINNSNIGGSAYAGGNGSTATVQGNTDITVGGNTVVGSSSCTVLSTCSVFGGGNAATTGSELTNDSTANVKIAGATIYGNVYGGANTSKVYGETNVNIGADVTLIDNVTRGPISIHGTVFGGGEANASGSDEYDWTFVSVTKGITVNINGNNYETFDILGSIFGSGNASTAAGTSEVTIKNYGTFNNPKKNTSIQRTDLLTIDNSSIILVGATDRENEYSDVLFSLSRIDELDLVNNSTLYLETGANLLQEFKSLTSSGDLAKVDIDSDNGTITKNVDNRVYMFIDKKLNIAKNQNVTDYGEVSGMSFFGMYKYNSNGTVNTGIYNKHDYGDTLDWGGVFDNVSSYVLGLHKANHDIEKDGFYTNYIDDTTSKNVPNYITPTPPSGPLYMWTIGEGVIEYTVELSASKYSTLGTAELTLRDFTDPNTTFQILGFDYSEIAEGISLVEKNNIKKIADNETDADTIFGLSMETSNAGWLANSSTQFLTRENDPVVGSQNYIGGNNSSAPTILFYLHHSKNIATSGDLGKVTIQLMSIRQIDALTKETKRLIITVDMSRVLFDTINYEGAMTAGRKYELFTSTATNITSSSSISAFYSLFNTGNNIYREGYHRSLVSNYVLPLNTKITMIDYSNDDTQYYYHIINQNDVDEATLELQNRREVAYDISMFEVMGAENSGVYYNDAIKNTEYYHSSEGYCNEEFIFIIDFGDTNITSNSIGNQLLIEIRDDDDETIYSVLAPQHLDMVYNIYTGKDAIIDMDGTIDKNKIYNGESLIADLNIDYTQSMVGSTLIYDTHYFDSKLGIKISLINEEGEVVTGTTLLGLYYEIDGVRYDPNIDGTTRIKIADKVDSAEKWVIVNTGTSKIASGNYKLRFESFGSADGIYYGLNSSDTKDFDIEIVNEIYGLDIDTAPEDMIINKDTGLNANDTDTITYNISYNSGLNNPSIRLKMYRRGYDTIDDTSYHLVDAQDYFKSALVRVNEKEYVVSENPNEETQFSVKMKDNLISGTYKLEFILYDDNSPIGTVDKYIIIK